MYVEYYNLTKEPFCITPDPEFLFLSESHKQAIASIIYGVEKRKGFIAITGDVGVGKTTIVRSYLEQVKNEGLKIAYIFNPNISFPVLLRALYQELGLEIKSSDVYDMVNDLYFCLIEAYKQGSNVVLIIDEAQNMPIETLENLRMLSNLERTTDKLIQIVLVGQPELDNTLKRQDIRQLTQRIAVRTQIVPLTQKESIGYIVHRLEKAGMRKGVQPFTGQALKLIVREAKGIPRLLNIIADNALVTGYGYEKKPVTAHIVREVVNDIKGRRKRPFPSWKVAGAMSVAFLCLVGFILDLSGNRIDERPLVETAITDSPAETTVAGPSVAPPTGSSEKKTDKERKTVKTVAKGDTLSRMAQNVYGTSTGELLKIVKRYNPRIKDIDRIEVGDEIVFPPPPTKP
jgi:general secretion pathway protein A